MGICSSKQHHSTASQCIMIDSSLPGRSSVGGIGDAIHKTRRVTYDDDQSSSTTTHQSTHSTDAETSSIATGNNGISLLNLSNNSSSESPTRPCSEPFYQRKKRNKLTAFAQKYQILSQVTIGYGNAGQVRRCIHRSTSQVCAVKTMKKSMIRRKDRIKREIDFLIQVCHPNIIQLYDVCEDDREVHIVTELCHGGELFDKIIEKASSSENRSSREANQRQATMPALCFSEKDAARIIRSLLSAMSYLHSNDIVHRDLKPENILFAEKDNDESPIKLIDFGLSIRHTSTCQPLRNAVGTVYYMAPEVLNGAYDRSCDLWSIGAICYVMLSGYPPFNGKTDSEILGKIRKGKYQLSNTTFWDHGVSDNAKDFIRRLLVMDPAMRWSADMALEHDWLKAE
ncbi:hypothetical protein ACHAXR_009604 [Thalassiosira sp. AJA248-18]